MVVLRKNSGLGRTKFVNNNGRLRNFYMRSKPARTFLIIAISLYILVSSTYGQYYSLAAADFISLQPKLENFDQEYLSAANQSELKMYGSGGFLKGFQLLTCLFGQSFHLLSQVLSPDQKNLVLRC